MMDGKNIKERINELNVQISTLTEYRAQLKQQLAEMQTPFKVGDWVTYDGAKAIWELRAIRPGYGDEPKYFGNKIKKDGTPGMRTSEIWLWRTKLELVRPGDREELEATAAP